jgi:hypothetical protein
MEPTDVLPSLVSIPPCTNCIGGSVVGYPCNGQDESTTPCLWGLTLVYSQSSPQKQPCESCLGNGFAIADVSNRLN